MLQGLKIVKFVNSEEDVQDVLQDIYFEMANVFLIMDNRIADNVPMVDAHHARKIQF